MRIGDASGMLRTVRDAVTVVTGGASGIGRALAQRFVAAGARAVVVLDRDGGAADEVAATIPRACGYQLDVTDEPRVAELAGLIEERHGPIDLWCSNAGILGGPGLGTDAEWATAWSVHVLAHVYAARHVLPRMLARDRGHLLVTASAAGLLTEADVAPYAVTKHGSVAIAEWLAIQYGGSGVGFSCLCPQAVRTAMVAGAPAESTTLHAGAVLEPAQVADAVLAGLAAGSFLILPHPQVAEYERRRASDRERWLAGMRKLRAAAQESVHEGKGESR
jgi:NAD(P)-dependent dehydrogenase (short-subunit alcohol dehydrogenase family)